MRDLVQRNPLNLKDYSPREYNEEERIFIKKYGENALCHWELMTDEQKADYEELEGLYSDFVNLFAEHYDDLKLYALMYRNVPLYNIENDIYSMLYFESNKDEIIGYKEKFMSDTTSPQAQVALLYSENEALFPKFCIKYANVNFQPNKKGNKDWELSVNSIKNFKDGNIPHVFSVNDLTDEQCRNILINKGKLPAEYEELYDKYVGECPKVKLFKENLNEDDFARDYFVPLIIQGHQATATFIEFIKNKIDSTTIEASSKADNEIEETRNYHNSISQEIDQERKTIWELTKEKEKKEEDKAKGEMFEMQLRKNIKSLRPIIWFESEEQREVREEEERKEDEKRSEVHIKWRKQMEDEIEVLRKQIKTRKEQVEKKHIQFLKDVTKTAVFRIMYDNQNEMEDYVGKVYELSYNREWLENPLAMKEMESRTTSANSIFELFTVHDKGFLKSRHSDELETTRINKRREEGKLILLQKHNYVLRYIMEKWCEAVEKLWDEEREKEREEQERKRKEEEARTAKYRYNQINAHPRDAKLSFDKGSHIYTVSGRVMDSVTTIIKNSFPEFDKKKWAPITAKKKGMTEREVLDMWEKEGEESREKGTLLHEKIENYYQGKQVYLDDTFRLFENMAKQVRLSPYRTEWAVYDYDLGVAGTVDFVDYQNGQYSLYDWKRSEKVIVNGLPAKTNQYGEKGNYPIGNLDNTPYWHYALQLSIYKYILEHNYGMEISRLRLGVFHPSYIKPYLLEMPYLEKEVNAIFSLRAEIIF